ncbi:MAG: NAD-dependent deacylase [Chloroflexota bacterium]|nr:NAD-dependent deacylase [Chloroflexota bacterium]
MIQGNYDESIDRIANLIVDSSRVVVFTGAGHSTESGISDFRSPGGIWTRYDPDDFTLQKFLSNPESRKKHWQMLGEGFSGREIHPNPAHYAVAELEKLGKLNCVITQNVDNLHQAAGNSDDRVFELHGNMQWAKCLSCGRRYLMEEMRFRVEQGEDMPDCEECNGILKPDAVFFGESLPQDVLEESVSRSSNCDLCIVIGSSLVVYPAALMPRYAIESGAKLVIINLTETPMDTYADIVIHDKAGEVMPKVVEKVKERIAS